MAGRVVGRRINEQGHRDDYNEEIERIQRFEVNEDPNKTNCLSTVEKDNMIAVPVRVGAMPNKDGELGTSQSRRIYSTDGKSVSPAGKAERRRSRRCGHRPVCRARYPGRERAVCN